MILPRPIRCLFAFAALLALSGAQAKENMHFSGNLVAGACTVEINGSTLAEVKFPVLNADDLRRAPSAPQPFSLQLKECDSALSKSVRVTFTGTEAVGLKGFLALDTTSAAGGVGIGIKTLTGSAVDINSATGATFTLASGKQELMFNAVVQTIPSASFASGPFSASATANFEYL